jgi:hypothetical protein
MQLGFMLFNIPVFHFVYEPGKKEQQRPVIGFNQANKE